MGAMIFRGLGVMRNMLDAIQIPATDTHIYICVPGNHLSRPTIQTCRYLHVISMHMVCPWPNGNSYRRIYVHFIEFLNFPNCLIFLVTLYY